MEILLRNAESKDIGWILTRLKKSADFYETKYSLYGDEAHSTKMLEMMLREHLFLIAEKNEEKVGMMGGLVTPHLYNPEIEVLTQFFLWVNEDQRFGKVFLKLLDGFVKFGKENSHWIMLNLHKNTNLDEDHFIKRGFHLQEKNYLMEVV